MSRKRPPLIDKNGEVRELTAHDKVKATLLREAFPELAAHSRKMLGRPKSPNAKKLQSFKLSPDVIEGIRKSGAGYNVRVEKVLRDALEKGLI